MDASNGQVRASVSSKNTTIVSTNLLPNLIISGSASTFGEIYLQAFKSDNNLTIAKFVENRINGTLEIAWEQYFNRSQSKYDAEGVMLKLD